jgi:hypothetical protein
MSFIDLPRFLVSDLLDCQTLHDPKIYTQLDLTRVPSTLIVEDMAIYQR